MMLTLSVTAYSRELYRYTNKEGNTVVDDRVPREYVAGGYEVITEDGIVITVVPPVLSSEELEQMGLKQQLALTAAAEEERLRKWDESLLLRYSSVEDIEAARDRAIQELNIRVSILKSNIRFLKQQVENYQTAAANTERNGGTVDVSRLAAIDDLQAEIISTERSITDRQEEISRTEEKYQLDIDRFKTLLEVVELRRSHSNKQ